jgi:Domain of unknown function (DUF5666)
MLMLVALVVLPSCGGGVDSGGTGSAPATLAVGPITGFGSVVVGGIHYDDSTADVRDGDDAPLQPTDLRLGMHTRIDAGPVASANGRLEAKAEAIRIDVQVRGPVDSVDPATSTLKVLGQTVLVNGNTALDALTGGLAALRAGDLLAVYGEVDRAGGRIVATRLAPAAAGQDFILRGTVERYDAAARRLVVGGQTLSLAQLSASDLPSSLAAGQPVRARLASAPVAGVWTVKSLRKDGLMLGTRDNVELEGRISALTSPQRFSVDGVEVDASAATFPDGTQGIVLGARVEVEGSASAGVITARTVKLEEDEDGAGGFELEGRITSVDAGARTFVLRGVTVVHDDATVFEGGNAGTLAANRKVSVKGTLADNGTRLLARKIELD